MKLIIVEHNRSTDLEVNTLNRKDLEIWTVP